MKNKNNFLNFCLYFALALFVIIIIYLVIIRSKAHSSPSYKIVYSYTCHEEARSFEDTLNNLFYFNEPAIAVVVHCNSDMFEKLPELLKNNKNRDKIYINDIYYSKETWTYSLLKAHIDNFSFCKRNNLAPSLFIPMASNCMLKKNVNYKDLEKLLLETPADKDNCNTNHYFGFWDSIYANKDIISKLRSIGVVDIVQAGHEGMIIPYAVMDRITNFVISENLENLVEKETVFEEFILSTLGLHYSGKKLQSICKVYFDNGQTPPLDMVNSQPEPCFKRVSRNYDDPRRVALRENNNHYEK